MTAAASSGICCIAPAVSAREVEPRDEEGSAGLVVHLDDGRATEVAIDPETGEVTAWRNRRWRLFDAVWSIHVLGYVDRRSPANWPLRVVAFLAAAAATSGAALLVGRVVRRWRRRSPHLTDVLASTPDATLANAS